MERRVLVLSSVRGTVVDDLVRVLDAVPGWRASVRSSVDGAAWMRRRGAGRLASSVARLGAFLFPLTPALGRACRAADVVVATTNPFPLPALVSLRARRTPLVTLVYDVYPDSLEVRRPLPSTLRRAVIAIVGLGLRRAAVVVTLGERVRLALVRRHGLTAPTTVIVTGADPWTFADAAPPDTTVAREVARALEDRTVVSYVGNAGSVHDVATLGRALAAVLDARSDVAAVISTRGDRAEELLGPLLGRDRVHVLPPLDDATWRWVTARTDVALVALDAGAGLASVPSKVHAALAAGSAVLAVAPDDSDLADLVRASGAGPVVAPGDVAGATTALDALVGDADLRAAHRAAARTAARAYDDAARVAAWGAVLMTATAARDLSGGPTTR